MRFLSLFVLFLFVLQSVAGREPYHTTLTVDTTTAKVSAPNLVDLRRELSTSAIEELIPIYTPISPLSLNFNLRGIPALASFAANSTDLFVEIPKAGISVTFAGATRDASLTLFKDYLRDGGKNQKLLRLYPKCSPIDPIAGNPNSLMAVMAEADYRIARLNRLESCKCTLGPFKQNDHEFHFGAEFGRAFTKDFETSTVFLPLRHTYSPGKSWRIIFDIPVVINVYGGAISLTGAYGTGFLYPVTPNWQLIPVVRFGTGGSFDLVTGGNLFSAGLASVYDYLIGDGALTMTNYANYATSVNLWLSGVNYSYNLHNWILKNGLAYTYCNSLPICGKDVYFSLSFVDTYFGGDRLYIKHYDEVSLLLIATDVNPLVCYDRLNIGFTWKFGQKDYHSYHLSCVYDF